MICYFRKGLKPFIKVKIEQQDRKSMDFEKIVQRTVNVEAKMGLRSSSIVRYLDTYCLQSHRPSNSTTSKVQIQGTTAKDSFCPEEPKTKERKSVCTNAAEPSEQNKKDKKDRQDKKRKFREYKWDHKKEWKEQTPATGTNTTNAGSKKK